MRALSRTAGRSVKRPVGRSINGVLSTVAGLTSGAIAGNRFQACTASSSIAANFTSRREHTSPAGGAISNLHTVDVGWFFNSTFGITNAASRTFKRYIEYPAGTFWQVTWAGATSKTLAGGAITTSDNIAGLVIPPNTKYWERTVNLGGTVNPFPVIELPAASTTLGVDDGNDVADKGNTGTVSATSTLNTFGAAVILCDIAKNNARSVIQFGDSLVFGQGDITTVDSKHGSGFLGRMLDIKGYGWFKLCKPGMSASDLAAITGTSLTALQALMAKFGTTVSEVIDAYGINDLRLGRTQTQLLADKQTYYSSLASPRPVRSMTITPRSTSTDSWATTTNQTAQTDGNMAALNSVNAAIRAGLANTVGYLEAADAAMSARDSDIHAAPPAGTTDGTHFTSVNSDRIATALAPAYP